MATSRHNQTGFTIVEVGIIVPLLLVFLVALFSTLYNLLQVSAVQRAETDSAYDIQAGLSAIEKDVMLSSQFLPVADAGIFDAYPPASNGGKWSYRGESNDIRALILRSYATTTNPESNERRPVFIDQNGCESDRIYYNDVLDYNTIYFVKNNDLYRRRIITIPPSSCSTPYQKQSCPSLETLGSGARHSSCQADDELIVNGVSSFVVTYYDKSNSTSAIDVYPTGADPDLLQTANAIKVTITTSRKAMGKTTPVSSSILIPRLNISRTGN